MSTVSGSGVIQATNGLNSSTNPLEVNPSGGNLLVGTTTSQVTGETNPEQAVRRQRLSDHDGYLRPRRFIGDLNITGKLNVATIDPVYTIDGTQYATYGESATGVHEETLENIDLTQKDPATGKYTYTVDFDTLAKGSDMWVFYEATDFGSNWSDLVVELTPSFDGTAFYQKVPAKHELLIEADQPGEVAVRLSADRFDASKWGTIKNNPDPNYPGFIISSHAPAASSSTASSGAGPVSDAAAAVDAVTSYRRANKT